MKNKGFFRRPIIRFSLLTVMLLTSTGFVNKDYYENKKLLEIESTVNKFYLGTIDSNKMQEGIYRGFVAGIGDIYTRYYTQEEFAKFMESVSGKFVGAGVLTTIDVTDNTLLIEEVSEGLPAQKAGILAKDKIIKVAGKTITDSDFDLAANLLRKELNTKVAVTIYRSSEGKNYDFELTGQNVTIPTVTYKMLDSQIGYIKINQFDGVTYNQFKKGLVDIQSKNAKGIVLDLRNNQGGMFDIAAQIADELLPKGLIVSIKDKNGAVDETYADDKYTNVPITVLINRESASASELLVGALKDRRRAKLIGEKTFGKGIVQSFIPLSDGSAIKLTTAKYFTPSGISIHDIGIEPDYKIILPSKHLEELLATGRLNQKEDTQLQKAMAVVKEEIKSERLK